MTTDTGGGSAPRLLGVDTGGTFTDFVFYDGRDLRVLKLASTPDAPEQAVLNGAQSFAENPRELAVVHGSTVATNALLEGRLARTAYVTNLGLADVLTIGRQARAELYNLQPEPQAPPVAQPLCLEVPQRTDADGSEVQPLEAQHLDDLVAAVRAADVEAVAINLLFSFKQDDAERRIEQALSAAMPDSLHISRSSAVLPEYREYERGIATWLNAALAPRMADYLGALQNGVGDLTVMHGAAGTMDAEQASGHAVNLLLSGPAGGLLGARFTAGLAGLERVMTLDMGGTSTDVALIDGRADNAIRLTSEARIGGYPVAVPMLDMHTIGAGGGSIAYIDEGGMLRVGPQSAGADPGPACYGRGGTAATVTDANVVLGRLPASSLLGGDLSLDIGAAQRAISALGEQMQQTPEEAALGIIRVANEAMAKALRVISVHRGEDPREHSLLCFGGAGGMHVCALAEALGMRSAMVPVYAGVLSALGMLVARRTRQLSQSLLVLLQDLTDPDLQAHIDALFERGASELEREGVSREALSTDLSLDLRYSGQSFCLTVNFNDLASAEQTFHELHEARYGHRLELSVEVVNVRASVQGPWPEISLPRLEVAGKPAQARAQVDVYGESSPVKLFERQSLRAREVFQGPAIIAESVSTTWLAAGWQAEVDPYGNLLLTRQN